MTSVRPTLDRRRYAVDACGRQDGVDTAQAANFRSTSMPFVRQQRSPPRAPLARLVDLLQRGLWMPNVHSGTRWRGLAIGVCETRLAEDATGAVDLAHGQALNTGSSKSVILHVLREGTRCAQAFLDHVPGRAWRRG